MKNIITKTVGIYLNTLHRISPDLAAKHGFTIFCNPFRTKLQKHHKQFLTSAKDLQLQIDGINVQSYKWGNGPIKVLFLHGWSSHTFRWKNYIERLPKDKFTLLAIDAPGHGLSEGNFLHVPLYAKTVKSFLDKVGKVDAVISHSIGSFTALYTFFQHQHVMPAKMVLLAPPGEAEDFFNFYTNTLKLNHKTTHSIRKYFEKEVGHPPTFFSAKEFAKSISSNGLLIHDEDDQDTTVQNSINIHQSWSNSELQITKGFGHHLKDVTIYEKVIQFIEKPVLVHT